MTLYYFDSVLPQSNLEMKTKGKMADKTYRLSENRRRIRGDCNGKTSLRQSIAKCLATERGAYPVYRENYGVALDDLWELPYSLVETEIKARIQEALLTDDRIRSVKDFSFQRCENGLEIAFTVSTEDEETIMEWRLEND